MKSLDEFKHERLKEFDKLFNHDNPDGKALVLIDDTSQRPAQDLVWEYIIETIDLMNMRCGEIVDEVIGGDPNPYLDMYRDIQNNLHAEQRLRAHTLLGGEKK